MVKAIVLQNGKSVQGEPLSSRAVHVFEFEKQVDKQPGIILQIPLTTSETFTTPVGPCGLNNAPRNPNLVSQNRCSCIGYASDRDPIVDELKRGIEGEKNLAYNELQQRTMRIRGCKSIGTS